MPKRPAIDMLCDEQPVSKAQPTGTRRDANTENEMGEFEDAWEDELESDEDVTDAHDDNGEDHKYFLRNYPQSMQVWMSMGVYLLSKNLKSLNRLHGLLFLACTRSGKTKFSNQTKLHTTCFIEWVSIGHAFLSTS